VCIPKYKTIINCKQLRQFPSVTSLQSSPSLCRFTTPVQTDWIDIVGSNEISYAYAEKWLFVLHSCVLCTILHKQALLADGKNGHTTSPPGSSWELGKQLSPSSNKLSWDMATVSPLAWSPFQSCITCLTDHWSSSSNSFAYLGLAPPKPSQSARAWSDTSSYVPICKENTYGFNFVNHACMPRDDIFIRITRKQNPPFYPIFNCVFDCLKTTTFEYVPVFNDCS